MSAGVDRLTHSKILDLPGAVTRVSSSKRHIDGPWFAPDAGRRLSFSVPPDGQRFVGEWRNNKERKPGVITNWFAELRRRTATPH